MEIFDVLVLGGGPGGYLCAERAAQNGLKAAVFEKKALTVPVKNSIKSGFLITTMQKDIQYNGADIWCQIPYTETF